MVGGWPFELQRAFALYLFLGGGAMEQYYPIILFLVIATGYMISIKK